VLAYISGYGEFEVILATGAENGASEG